MPGPDTVWKQEGSGALGIDHPVTLTYDNGAGLIFRRTIAVDDHYLFTLKDEVANKGSNPVTLFPYALVSRHGTPKVQGYYILHEGLIGVIGEQGLQTETYKKIDDKKSESWDATNVWLGITDKYWAATLLARHRCKGPRPLLRNRKRRREHLSDRLSGGSRRPSRPARPARPTRGCSPAPRKSPWSASISRSAARRRLQPGARPQPFRSVDRLGLVLLHHQADVPGHRLLLPSGRQFRHRHPDRHRDRQDRCSSRSPTNPTPRWRR